MKSFVVLVLIVPFLFLGCKKHEQPDLTDVNIDCDCASEVSADFEILELESLPQFNPVGTDSDTIFHESNVIFRAKEEGAEYTWYIGANVYHTKEVGLNFPAMFGGQDITVSLVVNKPTNAICLPNDDGVDSVSRTFYVQTYGAADLTSEYVNGTTLMEGVYRMKSPHLTDSIDITIDYIDRTTQPNEQIDILNYDGVGSNAIGIPRNISTRKTYRGLFIPQQTSALYCFKGTFLNQLNGPAIFEITTCEVVSGNYETTTRKYVGRKL